MFFLNVQKLIRYYMHVLQEAEQLKNAQKSLKNAQKSPKIVFPCILYGAFCGENREISQKSAKISEKSKNGPAWQQAPWVISGPVLDFSEIFADFCEISRFSTQNSPYEIHGKTIFCDFLKIFLDFSRFFIDFSRFFSCSATCSNI